MNILILLILLLVLSVFLINTEIYYYFGTNLILFFTWFKRPKNKFSPVPFKKRRIAIITTEDRNEEYITLHDYSISEYSKNHGYSYLRMGNCPVEESSTYWCKIHKVKDQLDSGNWDYVMWMDSDTVITNTKALIDTYISDFGEPDIIISEDNYYESIFCRLSAGVFLIKNSETGRSFINDCLTELKKKEYCIIDNKEQGTWAGACYEQGIMNLLIKGKYSKNVYVDYSKTFIFDDLDFKKTNEVDNSLFIHHLAGAKNNVRKEYFKKVIGINNFVR